MKKILLPALAGILLAAMPGISKQGSDRCSAKDADPELADHSKENQGALQRKLLCLHRRQQKTGAGLRRLNFQSL